LRSSTPPAVTVVPTEAEPRAVALPSRSVPEPTVVAPVYELLPASEIVAVTPARCLVMPRRDFLDFITHDFLIGLQFEEISSQRLGKPIFPLGRAAFAEAR
jgi:hypothetical protein